MRRNLLRSRFVWILRQVLVASLYILTAELGFLTAIQPGNVTALWPPSGIALAAVLLWGGRTGPGIWSGSFLANLNFLIRAHSLSSAAVFTSGLIALGSTLQAVLGAFFIRRFIGGGNLFDRPQDIFKFAVIEIFSCVVAASVGVTSLCVAGYTLWKVYAYTWGTWWMGDLVGVILVTPLFFIWKGEARLRWTLRNVLEAVGLLLLVLGVTHVVFSGQFLTGRHHYPLGFLLIPLLVWVGFRFRGPGVMVSLVLISGVAVPATLQNFGPFARQDPHESLLFLQAFIGILTLTGLVVAAAVDESDRAKEALRRSSDNLETRVSERTQELAGVNETLLSEIEKRKRTEKELRTSRRTLEEKISELEGLNEILLGREERIIELKEKLKTLQDRTGEKDESA